MVNPGSPFNTFANTARGFVDDPIGSLLRGVDNGQRVPVTKTKTAYSLTLHAVVGNRRGVIGAVHEISTAQSLQVDEEWEVDALARGLPRELVPQVVTGRSFTLNRYELYSATLAQVFGAPELITLADHLGPVSLRLMWKDPNPSDFGAILANTQMSVYEYTGCYLTQMTMSASMSSIIVGTNAQLMWTSIRRLQ